MHGTGIVHHSILTYMAHHLTKLEDNLLFLMLGCTGF